MLRAFAVVIVVAAGVVAAPVPKDGPRPPTREQLRASQLNLKHIALATHNYESTFGQLPNNSYSPNGKPLLSWRVLLLPYLETDGDNAKLYNQFNLNEPWDSEQNKKLVEKMPKVYAPIRVTAKPGETFYRGFAGPGAVFEPTKRIRILDITDGTSNTALVVEAGEPVIWTKPDDLPFDPVKPLPKLGGLFDGAFHVVAADGVVHTVKKNFDAASFKRIVTRSGAEVGGFSELTK